MADEELDSGGAGQYNYAYETEEKLESAGEEGAGSGDTTVTITFPDGTVKTFTIDTTKDSPFEDIKL